MNFSEISILKLKMIFRETFFFSFEVLKFNNAEIFDPKLAILKVA